MAIDLTTATKTTFDAHLGKAFRLDVADGAINLTLDNTKLREGARPRDNRLIVDGVELPPRHPFALTFVGPVTPVLPQGTYEIAHSDTGPLHLFLTPFRQDQDGVLYEAAFT